MKRMMPHGIEIDKKTNDSLHRRADRSVLCKAWFESFFTSGASLLKMLGNQNFYQ